MTWSDRHVIVFILAGALAGAPASQAGHFTSGGQAAAKFGVHEIVLTGSSLVPNPFDTLVKIRFTPPSGVINAKTVWAFYDGESTWRARVYSSETGAWTWSSTCETDAGLHGKSGTFRCEPSKLRGRLLIHPKNPRQWMTDNGRWFLNLNDTAYFLLCAHDGDGNLIPEEDVRAYVRDARSRGITSFRSFIANGPKSFIGPGSSDRQRWNDLFSDPEMTRPDLYHLRVADHRLRWLLDGEPDAYMQFILFPLGKPWRTDESVWTKMTVQQRERIMRYLIARFAAYPQIFWLIVNDAYFGPETIRPRQGDVKTASRVLTFPNSCAMVREVGTFFKNNDPWQHPLSAGPARTVAFHFDNEEWASYVHLEDDYDLPATRYEQYHRLAKPVFLGEDRYEQDHPKTRDPRDMRYFQRRLFWVWLFSGGSTNYGGRWWVLHPYSQTGRRPALSAHHKDFTYTKPLTGLDSVMVIRDYFETRRIELSDFVPDHALATDLDGAPATRTPKLMRRGWEEFLVYHPNAAADQRDAKVDPNRTARMRIDLREAAGSFTVEWYRARDGLVHRGGSVEGGRVIEMAAPWSGHDVVLRLSKVLTLKGP
jgi:hypothetical protein